MSTYTTPISICQDTPWTETKRHYMGHASTGNGGFTFAKKYKLPFLFNTKNKFFYSGSEKLIDPGIQILINYFLPFAKASNNVTTSPSGEQLASDYFGYTPEADGFNVSKLAPRYLELPQFILSNDQLIGMKFDINQLPTDVYNIYVAQQWGKFTKVNNLKIYDNKENLLTENVHYEIYSDGTIRFVGNNPYYDLILRWNTYNDSEAYHTVSTVLDTDYGRFTEYTPQGSTSIVYARQEAPNRPCYTAIPTYYEYYDKFFVEYEKQCMDKEGDPVKKYYSSSIESICKTQVEWSQFQLDTSLQGCSCIDVTIMGDKQIIYPNRRNFNTDIECACTAVTEEFVYRICPDHPEYLDYTDSTNRKAAPPENIVPNRRVVSVDRCDTDNMIEIIYHTFGKNEVLDNIKTKEIFGLFNTSQSLSSVFTSSLITNTPTSSYYNITDRSLINTDYYFSVSYGHISGSGSLLKDDTIKYGVTKGIYRQNALMYLDSPMSDFQTYTNSKLTGSSDIYVINFNRDVIDDRLDPGNFEFGLAKLNGGSYINAVYTGSKVGIDSSKSVLTFIDNSNDFSETEFCYEDPYYYYDIVSGSLQNGIYSNGQGSEKTNNQYKTYGYVYPNMGVIVLDGNKLNNELNFNSVSGSNISGDNAYKLFVSISGSTALGKPFKARNIKYKTTKQYLVRVPVNHANYTTNPTYTVPSGSMRSTLKHKCFFREPNTYLTTIGLYDSYYNLIAIAKLSKPIKKSPNEEISVKVRISL
jgi:hypothetical protein